MSDFEGEWDEYFPRAVETSAQPARGLFLARGQNGLEVKSRYERAQNSWKAAPRKKVPDSYRPVLQQLSLKGQITYGSGQAKQDIPEPLQKRAGDTTGFLRYQQLRSDQPADGSYTLMHDFKHFCKALPHQDDRPPGAVGADLLAQICVQTDTFIPVLKEDENMFQIWGSPEAIKRAQNNLRSFEMYNKAPGQYAREEDRLWLKQGAFNSLAEDRLQRENLAKLNLDCYRSYAQSNDIPYQAYLLWPDNISIPDYVSSHFGGQFSKADANPLVALEKEFFVVIRHDPSMKRTAIKGHEKDKVSSVYNRLTIMVKEALANKGHGLRAIRCDLPSSENYLDQVQINQSEISTDQVTPRGVPVLAGSGLPASEHSQWRLLRDETHLRYRLSAKSSVRACIKNLYAAQKSVRMKTYFGSAVLTRWPRRYRLASNSNHQRTVDHHADPPGQCVYPINDFLSMVTQSGIELEQTPLSVSAANRALVTNLGLSDQLDGPSISWIVQCDFANDQKTQNFLRLELRYEPSKYDPDNEPPELISTKWLKYSSNLDQGAQELVSITTMDLEGLGHRFLISAVPMLPDDKVETKLQAFARNVSFTPDKPHTKTEFRAVKHSVFPPGNPQLQLVKEITILKYGYTVTGGVLEVTRSDHFPQDARVASSTALKSEWSASYHYEQWDRYFDEFARLGPGEDVSWTRDINSFFPKLVDPDGPSLPRTFKEYSEEVEQVAELLKHAMVKPVGTDG